MSSFKPLDIPTIPLEGKNLIEASAGTGKTYTISHLYLRLILEKQYDIRSILVVTFTEAATKELIERIRANLSEVYQVCCQEVETEDDLLKRILENSLKLQSIESIRTLLRKAIIRFDEASIYTIHGFCKRILSDYSFETAVLFDTELVSDQQKLVQEITDDFRRITFSERPSIFTEIALRFKLDTVGLINFAFQLIRMPTARLIPEIKDNPFERVNFCLEEIKEEWKKSGPEIRRILVEDKGLKRDQRSYRPDVLEGYIESIEQLTKGSFAPQWLNAITMFAQETINSSIKKKHVAPGHLFFELCQQMVACEGETAIWIKQTFATYLKQELEKRKKELNIHGFDDLISAVHKSLYSDNAEEHLLKIIRENYRVALVDEFQDTDAIQYDIFSKIFSENSDLFLIGDPKQSIYSFRGADLFTYFQASKTVIKGKGFTLDTNWRSETGLVNAVNSLFSKPNNPFVLGKEISFSESQSAKNSKGNQAQLKIEENEDANLILWYLNKSDSRGKNQFLNKEDAGQMAIEAVTREISRLLELSKKGLVTIGDRKLQPSDIAILVLRNKDAQALKDRLTQINIPAVMTKSGDVFQTSEARDLQLIMEAVISPLQTVNLNTALATETIGLTGEEIQAYLENYLQWETYEEHIARFSEYRNLWKTKGFMRMFRKLLADYQVRKNLLGQPAGERKLTNLLHLAELTHSKAIIDKPGMNGLLSWLAEQRVADDFYEEHELRLERDDEAIQISTVFKSKGLQYPVVFCPFMWQRSAVIRGGDINYHQNGELIFDLGSVDQLERGQDLAQKETLADLIRLLYVALTRAKNRCYLVCGRIGKKSANSLDYIFSGGNETTPKLVSDLLNQISDMDKDIYLQKVRENLIEKQISLKIESPNSATDFQFSSEVAVDTSSLSCREYTGHNHWTREWGIASYSKFIAGETFSHQSDDDLLLTDEIIEPKMEFVESEADSFFSFPSGRVAGTCIHSIFEKLDFVNPEPEFVSNTVLRELNRFGLNKPSNDLEPGSLRSDSVSKMINRVLAAPLITKDHKITLNQVENCHKLVELEFHFPMLRLSAGKLQKLVQQGSKQSDSKTEKLVKRIQKLSFKPITGFMHGFIDLVFSYQGKYYIVDWKSNNLGATYSDYHPEKLALAMTSHLYDLQYHIYTIALNQYLEKRLPDYEYNNHFGGIFYLFVRGMHPDLPGNGVYFDLPSKELLASLSQIIR